MTPDLQREFQSLSLKARQLLRDVPQSGSYREVFSFWVMPAFAPSTRCTVYAPQPKLRTTGAHPFASFRVWRSDIDSGKLSSPVERLRFPNELTPTIEDESVDITDDDVLHIERRIVGIQIPVFLTERTIGSDGTAFEFRYGNMFCGVTLCWWTNYPAEWWPFTSAVTEVAAELEERRKQHRPS